MKNDLNIESIVQQWTLFDLKSIQVGKVFSSYLYCWFLLLFVDMTHQTIIFTFHFFSSSLFVKCFSIYLFELDFLISSVEKKKNELSDQTVV
jgi:hypothetical protein